MSVLGTASVSFKTLERVGSALFNVTCQLMPNETGKSTVQKGNDIHSYQTNLICNRSNNILALDIAIALLRTVSQLQFTCYSIIHQYCHNKLVHALGEAQLPQALPTKAQLR